MIRHVLNNKAGHRQAGFTLVEVLISLFIFALISVGTMMALIQSLEGKDRLRSAVAEINELNAARAIIRADITRLTLRPMRDELGGNMPYVLTTDGGALLTFTRRGVENPGGLEARGDLQRVEYHFENGNLIRRTLAHENPAQSPKTYDRILLDDLQDAKLWAMIYKLGSFVKIDYIRLQPSAVAGLKPKAILLETTDDKGEVTAHIFELGT
jgi:general secretion pathway protein J